MAEVIEQKHWRLYNALFRLLGVLFVPAAIGFIAWGVWLLAHPSAPLLVDGVPHTDVRTKLIAIGFPLPHLALGLYALRRRTYRPDLGDHHWLVSPIDAKLEARGNRDWWTGDPKSAPRPAAA